MTGNDGNTNTERVEAAHVALRAFAGHCGPDEYGTNLGDPDEFLTIAGDLIANLLHAADAVDVDADTLLGRAILHYSAESTTPYDLP
jgi:hypothetical protein